MMYLKYQKKYHKVLSWILSLLLVLSLFAGINTHVNAAVSDSTTVLVFTSDVHNDPNDLSSQRLGSWIDHMKAQYGHINCMGFCGDMGWARDTSFTEDQYWNSAKVAFDVIATKGIDTCFTTGNHEHDYGRFSTTTRPEKAYYTVTAEAKRDTNYHYHIYCLGSASATSEYTSDQISALTSYFSGLGENDTDPVIVLTHYPLHYYRENYWTVRSTANADKIIDALNSGVTNGRKVVLLWGHNHTLSDTNYDKVKLPGSSVDYAFVNNSAKSKTIQFYYAAAGCMSDSEYSSGSQSVKGKGLALVFDSSKKLNFIYHNASGTDINKGYLEGWPGDVPEVTVSLNKATLSLQEEETFTLQATVTPDSAASQGVTWSSSNSNVATVSSSGLVTAKKAGTANITVKTNDGNKTAVCAVTVTQPPPSSVTITWKNYDGSTIKTEEVAYGTKPTYTGSTPTREATAQYTYTFTGWSPTIVNATQDASYMAQYSQTTRKYTITWKDYDGSKLKEEQVAYGTKPSYGTDPTRASTAQYGYAFSGWTPTVVSVTGDASYTATYTESPRKYTITWKNYNGNTLKEEQVAYGTTPSYSGTSPTRSADNQYSYSFTGWSPEVTSVTGAATYTAQFTRTTRTYTITWQNYDGSILETDRNVAYGTKPTYDGADPSRTADAQYSYTFAGWDPTVENVFGDVTYTAQYTSRLRKYTITWKNSDGTTLETDREVEYGSLPTYNGATPSKTSTNQYNYTFAGWTPKIAEVTGNAIYTAEFTQTTRTYTITWKNYDGKVLETDQVAYGTRPVYNGETPVRAATTEYVYTFSKWSPDIEAVSGDATYTATFTQAENTHPNEKYIITWKDYDDSILKTEEVYYGTTPSFGSTPTREASNQYSYTFAGWTPEIEKVTKDAAYTATYTRSDRKYTITWKDYDGSNLRVDELAYGATPSYDSTPTRTATAQYSYTFEGWSPEITKVSGNATYTAAYTSSVRKYTITWENYDGSVLDTDEVVYGIKPVYSGTTPSRASTVDYIYTFSGWSPEIANVSGNASYRATFTQSANTHAGEKYTITWKNYDGSILKKEEIAEGKKPSYSEPAPARASTDQYSYTFIGWSPEIAEASEDASYVAQFKETGISKPASSPTPSPSPSSSSSASSSLSSTSLSKASASSAKAEQAKNTPPTVEEVKHAAVDSSLPVVNPEKIKTTASLKNATMKIELGTVNADYCLVEYKQSTGNSWKTTTSTASGSVTLTGMKKNGLYQYRITTVKEENGNLKKGKTSNSSYRWINNTKITKGNSKDKQLNLAWKKVKGASGYEIQYSTDKDFKKNTKKKTVKNKKTEKTISGLKKGKTYYVRIRPVKKKDGKNYLGIFTNAKKVKIK